MVMFNSYVKLPEGILVHGLPSINLSILGMSVIQVAGSIHCQKLDHRKRQLVESSFVSWSTYLKLALNAQEKHWLKALACSDLFVPRKFMARKTSKNPKFWSRKPSNIDWAPPQISSHCWGLSSPSETREVGCKGRGCIPLSKWVIPPVSQLHMKYPQVIYGLLWLLIWPLYIYIYVFSCFPM